MTTPKQKFEDILDQLKVAADVSNVVVVDSELKSIASRLVKYHGAALARILASLPGRQFFPTGAQIEQEICETLGKKVTKGLTAAQIDKNEHDLVLAGQPIAKAKAGAEMMRKTLRKEKAAPAASTKEAIADIVKQIQKPSDFHSEITLLIPGHGAVTVPANPLAGLEDFGEDPLSGLEDF